MQTSVRRRSTFLAHAVSAVLWGAVAATLPATLHAQQSAEEAAEKVAEGEPITGKEAEALGDDVTALSDISVTEDPMRAFGNEPSASSFGFTKPLLETPRSVSFVSEEQIRLFGISTVEDLTRVVPGTYTTTRYGLQGGVNVRGVSADMYYRGMKRLQMQGHVRTVLSAMDNIEIVKGPPSPLFGMGRIGGYANLDPKSSRARTGKYLMQPSGSFQATTGSYDKSEVQIGTGFPFALGEDRPGGLYVFGLVEDSDTYVKHVEAKQKFIQMTTSIDNMVGPFRLEFGGQLQNSVTSGAYMNRVTQKLIDNGEYIRGNPLKNLDLDADGRIGLLEHAFASPVRGNFSSTNLPLRQSWAFPFANGATGAATVPGIPAAMLAYLNSPEGMQAANCRAADVMRAMPAGGPTPQSGALPIGFVLNPCTVSVAPVDWRGNGAYEREQNGDQKLGYIDLIYDINPDFTVKNQFFYDNIDSFKDSWLPYGENQYIKTIENKLTVTKKVPAEWLPQWLDVNTLGSVNYRRTSGWILSGGVSGNDYDYRQDVLFDGGTGTGGHYPNTMFWTQFSNSGYATGSPAERYNDSVFDEKGVALMLDIDMWRNTNLVMGMRYDKSHAEARDMRTSNQTVGNLIDPATGLLRPESQYGTACQTPVEAAANAEGQAAARAAGCIGFLYTAPFQVAEDTDSGKSWSISLSQQLPWGLRPYFTAANSSLTLDGSNNIITASTIQNATTGVYNGFIGEAFLREVGIKGSWFGGKLQGGIAGYRQSRNDVTQPDDPTAGADVSATEAEGIELEMKWMPIKDLFLSGYWSRQTQEYVTAPASSATFEVDGRQVGFQDIYDPVTGELLYPAEAFLYGGRSTTALPAGSTGYQERVGNPETQASIQATYRLRNGFGFLLSSNYFSEVYANRQKTILLPEALVYNAGVTWDKGKVHVKLNGYNFTDERYFRPASGDTNGQLVSVMPGRRWEASLKVDF
ncbi:MAG TPA: TonB-dependent receptor [Povalibacter sp.]|uniref:TonB-dependent receptor n=1 Tax=Povalibacter sp. TaxID=1962978 RepID=UPI002BDC5A73|nr:TonB-dependent receptor [Povalibacter sp.]HMN43706.1 TonB-dependent receptor [Povalibacter sp.]